MTKQDLPGDAGYIVLPRRVALGGMWSLVLAAIAALWTAWGVAETNRTHGREIARIDQALKEERQERNKLALDVRAETRDINRAAEAQARDLIALKSDVRNALELLREVRDAVAPPRRNP